MDPELDNTAVETPPSLRETIELAVEEHEEPGQQTPPAAEPATEPPAGEPAPTAPGQEPPKPEGPGKPEGQELGAAQAKSTTPAGPPELKAPSQWKATVREKWNGLPREVQEEILRREGDSMRLIGSVGPKIRLADEISQLVAPYSEHLKSSGISVSSFVGDLFSTVSSLSSGNPQEKAEVVANIVQSYGVDLRALDAILSQRIHAGPEVAEARRVTAQARATIQQHQQSQDHQNALEAEKVLAAFGADPKHEFLDDVRDLMADLIEAGQAENLEDAYSAAIWAHPDTRKILLQREAQSRVAAKTRRASAARAASASVHGTPSVAANSVAPTGNMNLRQTIEAAFDEHST